MKRLLLAAVLAVFSFPAMAQVVFPPLQPITGTHRLPYDATSRALTGTFTANTEYALFTCTTACFIKVAVSGVTPTAVATGVATGSYIPADTPTLRRVPANGKVAVIQLSSTGVLFIEEVSR